MDYSMPTIGTAPRPTPDLRPVADAAATARIVRPPAPVAPAEVAGVTPVSVTQTALVSRSLVDGAAEPGAVDKADRVLKPYGVSMLPHAEREVPMLPPRGTEGEPAEAEPRD